MDYITINYIQLEMECKRYMNEYSINYNFNYYLYLNYVKILVLKKKDLS